ncbi:hypothetical protein C5167_010202 [Papaver somniferum]|uniref:Uncharacterized protein n=1 Tax=Papaver somniferum TaxID=3469 RepID=A0A4Y7K3I5_PAPSO|nr:hypothetical protein C5167_010202 [Papaver somniferum]
MEKEKLSTQESKSLEVRICNKESQQFLHSLQDFVDFELKSYFRNVELLILWSAIGKLKRPCKMFLIPAGSVNELHIQLEPGNDTLQGNSVKKLEECLPISSLLKNFYSSLLNVESAPLLSRASAV